MTAYHHSKVDRAGLRRYRLDRKLAQGGSRRPIVITG